MPKADGSIVIEVKTDSSQAEKNLKKLSDEIKRTESEIYETQEKRDEATKKTVFSAAELDAEKIKLEELKSKLQEIQNVAKDTTLSPQMTERAKGQIPVTKEEIKEQQTRVNLLQAEYNKLSASVERYDGKLASATQKLNRQKEEAGGLAQKINAASKATNAMAKAQERAQASAKRLSMRMQEVVRSALVFSTISYALSEFREWMWNVIKTNEEASASIARLKGALLTLVQPLVEIILPAFTTFVNVLARIVSVIASFVSALFGKTIEQSKKAAQGLNKQTSALEGVGAAAEEATGSLAAFDEINTISTETALAAGGGGGGISTDEIAPDFSFVEDIDTSDLEKLLELVQKIASALLAWKIGSSLGLGLKEILGLALAIHSAIGLVQSIFDAWTNGVSLGNLLDMLLNLAGLVAGLYIAFGKIGAAIGLIVGGIAMLAIGIKDVLEAGASWENLATMLIGLAALATGLYLAFGKVWAAIGLIAGGLAILSVGFLDAAENGLSLQNMLMMVSGLMAAGIGISILTGSFLPALIAGFLSALLAITYFFGDGEALMESLKKIVEGFSEFFSAVFTGDMEAAAQALKKIWEGIKESASIVWEAIKKAFKEFGDWFIEWGSQKLWDFWQKCEEWGEKLRNWWSNLWDGVKEKWDKFWAAIGEKISNLTELGKSIINNIKQGISDAWSGLTKWFNNLWDGLFENREVKATIKGDSYNTKSRASIPDVSSFSIPRLATGSVIPPNREFMAVLGDNKTETEVVSPLSTMKQALLEALQEAGGLGGNETITVVVNLDGREVARNTVKHVNNMTRAAGKPVLLF